MDKIKVLDGDENSAIISIVQKYDEVVELLLELKITPYKFSHYFFARSERGITAKQVENVLSVAENMATYGDMMEHNEFGEHVGMMSGSDRKLTELEKINGILDRAGIPE